MAIQRADEFTLTATGDAILTRALTPYEGVSERFDRLLRTLREADATVTNLEVLVHDYEGYPGATSGGTYMRAPPVVLDELAKIGCNLFSAATNHTFDFTHGGVEATIAHLEARGLSYAGLGRNRYEARRPTYVETRAGRVALVSACTSYPPGSEAGEQSSSMAGRPGLNPLGVEQRYRLPEEDIERLRAISETAGIEAMKQSWLDRGLYHNHDWNQPEFFHFADMKFERAEDAAEAGVTHSVDEEDRDAVLERVEEANVNADWVVASVHTHQGVGGRQNTRETPAFLVEFARDAAAAGADAVVAHGPHVLRGIELYDGTPICYSLGNFIVQNETVERLPPESFRRYGLGDTSTVSAVFDRRLYDDAGEPKGDLANDAFWRTAVPEITFGPGGFERMTLHPVTLQRDAGRPQRGVPVLAVGEEADGILHEIDELSATFGTTIRRDDGVGIVER